MQVKIDPENFLPLKPAAFHILLALVDGERHGYGIMQEVRQSTNNSVKLGPGTLYGTIKRLLADKLILESEERPDAKLDDERRRYYCLTELGRRVITLEVQRLANLVNMASAKKLLDGSIAGGNF
ncbi:PadR family transcriptional regulator [Microseira sp. BLCC-F43]|jgi:DNA-binding PadR family transcriptional regulator|uniref:PadR family transcriptional regulator n=1 Tax=Microseira sp. BLCC-F43 TaxID=3153602 RepID=UPI0035BA8EE0